jgi:CTP-dependent riboflavin kinase
MTKASYSAACQAAQESQADISIDGEYMGSTPSSLRVKPGYKAITIDKPGFKPWQRTLNVQSDAAITVEANPEKSI